MADERILTTEEVAQIPKQNPMVTALEASHEALRAERDRLVAVLRDRASWPHRKCPNEGDDCSCQKRWDASEKCTCGKDALEAILAAFDAQQERT